MKESLSRRVRLSTTRTERIPNLLASIDPNKTRMDSIRSAWPLRALPVDTCVPSPCRIRTYPFPPSGAEVLQTT